ncbi:S8 family serine peptidase [Streptomyces sp. LN785]|uniref:S8 family serine peptidase n=1 Tax=Streptomyces sp. LN785 TaxID=3112983 RepID=UPI00371239AB
MPRPFTRGSLPVAVALTALVAAGAAPAGATSDGGPQFRALKPSATAAAAHTVRLITGDSVIVTGKGEQQHVMFQAGPGNPGGSAEIEQYGTNITVIPDEARPLLASGALDARLFDVDALIAQGYADGADVPVIVQNKDASAPVPEGSKQVRRLPGIKAAAARVETKNTRTFWSGLRSTRDGATARKLADGVSKVWLDAKVEATLDKSVPQIGAPEAWAEGYDGKGVKVAVLDTGVDATHPDLAGRIAETRNFSDSDDAVDRFGHGTHVASTIVGSGAGSGGRYKGVAPEADLLIGKVLGDNGSGSDSSVLAGMDWAAHSGAKVISMSLGTSAASDGTDPLSAAVDTLTAETGSLFVIAAGNTGPKATTIGSPGAADSALTVAAVDKQDQLASFSSRGPRLNDNALKPDIAAPGVDIVAARAAGTSMGTPVDKYYTSSSGTSMATPHVAGAAAIVAEAHPDWSAADIKGALMSGAKVLDGGGFAEGSGRTYVPDALKQTVWASNASFGTVAPKGTSAPVTRSVTFHNTSDKEVTLALSGALKLDGGAVADGALTLGADTLTLPAGGAKDLQVTVAPDLATAYGTYTGTIIGTGDGVTTHATVALNREQPTVKLTLKGVMPDGTPAQGGSALSLYSLTDSSTPPGQMRMGPDGIATAQIKPGRYTIVGHLRSGSDTVSFGLPEFTVGDQDVSLKADGRDAQPLKVKTPKRSELRSLVIAVSRRAAAQSIGVSSTYVLGLGGGHHWALPAPAAKDGAFGFTANWSLQAPAITAKAQLPSGAYDLNAESFPYSAVFDGTRRLSVVDAGHGTEADLTEHAVKGKLALIRVGSEDFFGTVLPRVLAAGPAAVMVVNDSNERYVGSYPADVPVFGVFKKAGDKIAAAAIKRPVPVSLTGETSPSYSYQLVDGQSDGISADQTFDPPQSEMADIRLKTYASSEDPALAQASGGWLGLSVANNRGAGAILPTTLGTGQHVYVNAEGTKWERVVTPTYTSATSASALNTYAPGSTVDQDWFAPVQHATSPAVSAPATGLTPSRDSEGMMVQIPVWATASGATWESFSMSAGDTDAFRAYRDGQLLGSAAYPYAQITGLPDAKSEYRFEVDGERTAPWSTVSTEAHTAWTFSSAAPTGTGPETLPMLLADYQLDGVALDSSVKAGKPHGLKVAFRNADGSASPVARATVQASYDGGKTWHKLSTDVSAHAASVTVRAPLGADSVSLRVQGENAAGSTIDQTVVDAVRVS